MKTLSFLVALCVLASVCAEDVPTTPDVTDVKTTTNATLDSEVAWLDLDLIRDRVMHENEWEQDYASQVVKEYKRFLIMHKLFPKRRLVPSLHVDEAWHAHILFTHKYGKECRRLFGHFLHHDPSTTKEEHESDATIYDEVLKLYQQTFGEPAGTIWTGRDHGQCCSNCKADGLAKCGSNCGGKCGGGEFDGKCGSGKCSGKCGAAEESSKGATCGSGKCSGKCGAAEGKPTKGATCGSGKCSGKCGAAEGKPAKCSGHCGSKCGAAGATKKAGKCSGHCGSKCGASK